MKTNRNQFRSLRRSTGRVFKQWLVPRIPQWPREDLSWPINTSRMPWKRWRRARFGPFHTFHLAIMNLKGELIDWFSWFCESFTSSVIIYMQVSDVNFSHSAISIRYWLQSIIGNLALAGPGRAGCCWNDRSTVQRSQECGQLDPLRKRDSLEARIRNVVEDFTASTAMNNFVWS